MTKKKTSFTLDTELLKSLKMKAVQLDTNQTKLLEKFIKEGLKDIITDNRGTLTIEDIKPNLLKTISKIAKNKKITEKEVINDAIENGIDYKKLNKIPEHLISNKDTYNSHPTKKELNSIIGIMEAPKDFDVVKEINNVRVRKW